MRVTEEMLNWFGSFFFGLQHLGVRIQSNIKRLSGLFQSSWMLINFVVANEKVAKAFHEIWNHELAQKLGLIQLQLTKEDQAKQRKILNIFRDNLRDLTQLQENNFGTKAKSANKKEDRLRMETFFDNEESDLQELKIFLGNQKIYIEQLESIIQAIVQLPQRLSIQEILEFAKNFPVSNENILTLS
jgi:hypothetical protein